ncbi:MAG: right-handed parallel beta-helix repeat-containing protein, partial [Methanosarcina sp.]|nr:right-handed parallel beta-helix repeat-containing protein [Methanosarcina sp.]
QLLGSSDVTVYDMSLKWGTGDGIKITNGKNANIHDNVIDRIGHDGIYLKFITNADVYNNWICVKCSSGVRIVDGDNIKIHDNEIMSKKQGVAGMEIQKPNDNPMNVEIYNNKIYTTYYSGIWAYSYKKATSKTSNIVIHDNEITDCGHKIGGGITIHGVNVVLENNKITDNINYDVGIEYIDISYTADSPSDRPQGSGYKIILKNNEIGSEVANRLPSTHTIEYTTDPTTTKIPKTRASEKSIIAKILAHLSIGNKFKKAARSIFFHWIFRCCVNLGMNF